VWKLVEFSVCWGGHRGRRFRVELLNFTSTEDAVLGLDQGMAEDGPPLNELLQKAGDGDILRAVAESVLQLLMEADVEGLIGAGRHERAADRMTWRNGYCDRALDTRLGTLNLKIPKLLRGGQLLPALSGCAPDDRRKRLWRSSRKHRSAASRPARTTRSPRPKGVLRTPVVATG
jgi:hypothetical protein